VTTQLDPVETATPSQFPKRHVLSRKIDSGRSPETQ